MKKTIVYMPGVWDMLHVGHVEILERAKACGDILIVGVPTDKVVVEDKGQPPIIPCDQRGKMLQSLKCVDMAIPYDQLQFVRHLQMFDVDVLVVGEFWGVAKRHTDAEKFMDKKGGRVVQFSYTRGVSTTAIKQRVLDQDGILNKA